MDVRLHFLEAAGSLDRWRPQMEIEAKSVSSRIDALVPASDRRHAVDVVVRRSRQGIIPELGLGGSCYEPTLATIALAPDSENFEGSMAVGAFGSTLAHELHHALRHAAVGYGSKLGEAIVSEGLADRFATEVTGCEPPVWVAGAELTPIVLEEAELELRAFGYDHPAWFFGRGTVPRRAGYAIGWRVVDAFLTRHPDESAASLVGTHADAILSEGWSGAKTSVAV